ncbi:hypothetical protein B296_00051021, partial [Ensete ventricosum]
FSLNSTQGCFHPPIISQEGKLLRYCNFDFSFSQLLGDMLLDRSNSAVMIRYVSSKDNLMILMNLLRVCFPYQAVPPVLGGMYHPLADRYADRPLPVLPGEIDHRVVADDFDRRRPISSGISEGGRRRGEPGDFFARSSCDPSPAGDFFSPCWEKKHLPTWGEGSRRRLYSRVLVLVRRTREKREKEISTLSFEAETLQNACFIHSGY